MIQWLTHTSAAIKGFPMGDAHERTFPVYLPPQYNPTRPEPYPVIFLLAGYSSRGAKLINEESVFSLTLPQRFDYAIQQGEMPPAIIVFPDGSSRLGGSQYLNSPALGNYMDYIAEELPAFIDSQFNTHKSADYRGVAGHSSGGFGALMMGMLRPEAFKYIASSAGDSYYELSMLPLMNSAISEIAAQGSIPAFLNSFLTHPNPSGMSSSKFNTMMLLAMAPCYAPNLKNSPLYGDLFFDLHTGKIIDEIWQKYLNLDPVRMIEKYQHALHSLKWIDLDAGAQDEYGLQLGQRQIAAQLKKFSISHHFEEYPGGHSGHNWRYVKRLKLMLEKMNVKVA